MWCRLPDVVPGCTQVCSCRATAITLLGDGIGPARPGGRTDVETRITPAGAIAASCGVGPAPKQKSRIRTVVAWDRGDSRRKLPASVRGNGCGSGEIPTRPHTAAGITY